MTVTSVRTRDVAIIALAALGCLAITGAAATTPEPETWATGFIDRTGAVVLPPACDYVVGPGEGDWISVSRDGKQGFVNLRTKERTGLIFDGLPIGFGDTLFGQGIEPVRKGAKYGYVDRAGRTAIPFVFDQASPFSKDGLAVAGEGAKVGFINRKGRFVIAPAFDAAGPFDAGGLASVAIGRLWGAIDRDGRIVVSAKYQWLARFENRDLAVVRLDGARGVFDARMGAVDRHGVLVVPIKFGGLGPFSTAGLAAASLDLPYISNQPQHWGLVNRTGEFVLPPEYANVSTFDTPLNLGLPGANPVWARVTSRDEHGIETEHYVDIHGNVVLSLPPGMIVGSGSGLNANGLITVIGGKNRTVPFDPSHPPDYRHADPNIGFFDPKHPDREPVWYDALSPFGSNGLAPVKVHGLWGYIDQNGAMVIRPQFATASAFATDGLARVSLFDAPNGYAAFIDTTGKVVVQTKATVPSTPFLKSGFAEFRVFRKMRAPIDYPASACGKFEGRK